MGALKAVWFVGWLGGGGLIGQQVDIQDRKVDYWGGPPGCTSLTPTMLIDPLKDV